MEVNNITLIKYKKCCGCEACAGACPLSLIEMKHDDAGFLYPQIIKIEECVNCGLCLKKCPVSKDNIPSKLNQRRKELFFWVKDRDELLSSSSGGLATHLYRKSLEGGVYIVGVQYTDDFMGAQYILTNDAKNMERFKGSKYIQACKNDIYNQVKKMLNSGSEVLFIGLPCEVAAMKLFSDSEKLYTCELVCHGPTSSKVLSRYISHLEERQKATVVSYTSRFKNPHWKPLNSRIIYDNGITRTQIFADTELGKAFQMVKRYSCYHCEYKNGVTAADLTIGDFHAANSQRGDYNPDGVSICLVNTQRGQKISQSLADDDVVTGVADHVAAMANRALVESLPKLPGRERFIRIMKQNGLDVACKDVIVVTVLKYRRYPHRARSRIRRILRRIRATR